MLFGTISSHRLAYGTENRPCHDKRQHRGKYFMIKWKTSYQLLFIVSFVGMKRPKTRLCYAIQFELNVLSWILMYSTLISDYFFPFFLLSPSFLEVSFFRMLFFWIFYINHEMRAILFCSVSYDVFKENEKYKK